MNRREDKHMNRHNNYVQNNYSQTSKERTFWEQAFCPLFGGCPYLGGSLNYIIV